MPVQLHDTYSFCIYCGGKLKHDEGTVYTCQLCSKRSYLSPTPGCNCILIQNDACLMVQRARDPDAGTWSLPGGFSHPDETCEETMIREAHEELGIQVAIDGLVGSDYCTYIYQGIGRPVLVIYGVGRITSGDIVCADDVSDYQWVTQDALRTLPLFHEFEVEMISKAFSYKREI